MPINYKDYHPKWSLISRIIRTKRANNRCEWCGAENYKVNPIDGSRVVLAVAHIDRNILNNRFSNLVAVCQRCHLKHDRTQHSQSRRYGKNHYKGQMVLFQTGL